MGTFDMLYMSLIVAMSVKQTFVAQCFSSAQAFWGDMINLHDVLSLKEQSTAAAFSALLLEQFSKRSIDHGMSSQSLAPVEKVTIVGASCTLDFVMSLNFRAIVFPQERLLIAELPSLSFRDMPVFVGDPEHPFVWVSASSPALELLKPNVPTVVEGLGCDHTPIVVRPAVNHLIHFFDELSL
jgi:hypothetical protein